MSGIVEKIFTTPRGGEPMERRSSVEALENRGLKGDRYCEGTGFYSNTDECQVTLINAEDMDTIERETGVSVSEGQHRRNLVVRGLGVTQLLGSQFRIGEAVLEGTRPRPPCRYIERISEPGMTQALLNRGGICASVLEGGKIREKDNLEIKEE